MHVRALGHGNGLLELSLGAPEQPDGRGHREVMPGDVKANDKGSAHTPGQAGERKFAKQHIVLPPGAHNNTTGGPPGREDARNVIRDPRGARDLAQREGSAHGIGHAIPK
eukprot:14005271-Alexandrium_andersonii.AAC.1